MKLIKSSILFTIFLQFTFTTGVPPEPGLLVDPGRMCRRGRRSRDSTNFIVPGKVGVANHRQRRKVSTFCIKEPEIIHEATKGARIATLECQHQFKSRHWNCSALPRSIRKILSRDTRETAFVNAITAAGVTHAVTEGCSSGRLHDCPCDRSTLMGVKSATDHWEWGGCGDNVLIGYKRSQDILDLRSRRRNDLRSVITLHNNEAGRLAVRDYMETVCKCHGLSGSCALRTCWHKVPKFRDVGERLKRQFDGAIKVIPGNDGKSVLPAISTIKPPGKQDLLYFEDSADFCLTSRKTGSLGTTGRECNADSMGVDGCDLLCCGRGYTTRVIRIQQNCKCQFKWCCEVTCQTCITRKVINTCR